MIENKLIDNNKYGFINRLEEFRLQLGYTKVELAEYLDVYKSLVSLVYANKRSITQNFFDKLVEKKVKFKGRNKCVKFDSIYLSKISNIY